MKNIIILVSILLSTVGLTQKSVAQYDTTLSNDYNQTLVLPEISPYTIGKKNGGPFVLKPNDYQTGNVTWNMPCNGGVSTDDSLTTCGPGHYGVTYKKNDNVWTYLDIYIRYFVDIIDSTAGSTTYGQMPDTVWIPQSGTATLSVNSNSGMLFDVVNWKDLNSNLIISYAGSVIVSSGMYRVAGIDSDNYSSKDTIVVAEICIPSAATIDTSICESEMIFAGGAWQNTAGTYYDTLTNVSGCDSIITTILTMNPLPILTVSPIDTIVCAGSTITLHAGGTGTSYNWSTSETTQDISVMSDTSVSIWVSASNAYCTVTDTINITVNPVFSSTNVVEINNGQSYIINGHTYTTTGIYYDTLFTVHGCDSVVITNLTVLTDILTTSQTGEVPVIYPKPVNDILTINIARISTGSTTATPKVEIINLQGQVVKSIKLTNAKNTIDVKELIGGIYTLRMITDKGIFVRKLVKE